MLRSKFWVSVTDLGILLKTVSDKAKSAMANGPIVRRATETSTSIRLAPLAELEAGAYASYDPGS